MSPKAIYEPRSGRPMRVAFFASGGPGNLSAALDVADLVPQRVEVALLVTDRDAIPAIDLARARNIPVLIADFREQCGTPNRDPEGYGRKAQSLHDRVAEQIEQMEVRTGVAFDLAVLAYRRIITGRLYEKLAGKMINQHPADLSIGDVRTARTYAGIDGHARALRSGAAGSRTSTILVDAGVDTGELLCQGPWVPYCGDGSQESIRRHEEVQKSQSDWPSLRFALAAIALGGFAVSERRHPSGARVVTLFGQSLPEAGHACDNHDCLRLLMSVGELAASTRSGLEERSHGARE